MKNLKKHLPASKGGLENVAGQVGLLIKQQQQQMKEIGNLTKKVEQLRKQNLLENVASQVGLLLKQQQEQRKEIGNLTKKLEQLQKQSLEIKRATKNAVKDTSNELRHLKKLEIMEHYQFLPKSEYPAELCRNYRRRMGKELDLDNPKTLSEKIQWLKLHDSTPLKTQLADKWAVRDWIKDKIGEDYLIPAIGVYTAFEDIPWSDLPNQFVMKGTHGSSMNMIVADKAKVDVAQARRQVKRWLERNYALRPGLELHYKDIPPKIIIENYIGIPNEPLFDYKFFCLNGKSNFIQAIARLNGKNINYRCLVGNNWESLPFHRGTSPEQATPPPP
ncbi:MAG: hypothetical protein FWG65_05270, partial [Turicibacter sp.]|nr:hypothetical protein [Turicibacter sp.]